MAFRFVHTADIHLDSPLRSLALRDPTVAERVGVATREAFSRTIDLCLDERVDAFLIVGDLYDGSQVSMKTAQFLAQQLRRLDAAGIRTFIVRGNHDAISRITRELELPKTVTVFEGRASSHVIETGGLPVVIHGLSFSKPHAPDSLLSRFPAAQPGAVNIGMLHTSLNGSPVHDVYSPCSVADLQATGYDYWALGHIHIRAVHLGRGVVVMPGMPQGRNIGEAGPKSITLAQITDDGAITLEERSVRTVRFERLDIDVDGVSEWSDLIAVLDAGIRAAEREDPTEHLVLRPRLVGKTPLGWRIPRDLDRIRAEAELTAEALGTTWIDKVENDTVVGDRSASDDLPAELAALIQDELTDAPATLAEADEVIGGLLKSLPPELRDMLGDSQAALAEQRNSLMRAGVATVLALLSGRENG
ncbi:metallophosphoesterase family protein [Zavarzinia compransoris]|uniref:metallophosphoesterase family protein n=1 Tax=Zavarzinia compransoris TaxID=1264899 RepID=UPI0010D786CD|nr:DNA repair exonuclease [Zavarzinia compransoris]TDP44101.1 DNA repair exonuclease SbcCD nuclease subunit [Zavarzinia compransoris]